MSAADHPPPLPTRTAWLLTGLPGAGKSTVARLLCRAYPRAAHLEGDRLQALVESGLVWPHRAPVAEAELQAVLEGELAGLGLWVDSSALSAEETVAAILRDRDRARLAPGPLRPRGRQEPAGRPQVADRATRQEGGADATQ